MMMRAAQLFKEEIRMSNHNSKNTLLLFLAFVGVVCSLATPLTGQPTMYEKIDEIVQAEARYDLFSGVVLVAEDGKITYSGGFGEANKEYHIPNSTETKFNISSIQKTFIATLIMQLYQETILDLDDPLTKYYPECPWRTAGRIQIRHLLNHTSGLGDYRDSEEYRMNSERYRSINDLLPLVFKQQPAFNPGERFRYSNAGVLLLKGIIEKITGEKLKQALEERIWHPLGMDNTTLFVGGDLLENRATAYTLADDAESYVRVREEPSAYAGGGVYTTVLDLLRFDQALQGEELLSEETKKIMFTPVEASPNYAYGWIVVDFGGTKVIYHGGGSGGFNSEFRRYPDKGYTLVVLSNYPEAAFELANRIDCMLLGLPYSVAIEADLQFKRGMHFQDRELYIKAAEAFGKNLTAEPPHMPSLYQAARTRILGEFDQETAINLLDRYISLADQSTRPSIAAAWWRKGVVYEQLGDIQKAIACHEKCLDIDGGWTEAKEALEKLEPKR
jgi:CubicO group peptidase (beta-lactamase class C family)